MSLTGILHFTVFEVQSFLRGVMEMPQIVWLLFHGNPQALLRRFVQDNFTAQVLSCEPLTEAEDGGFSRAGACC